MQWCLLAEDIKGRCVSIAEPDGKVDAGCQFRMASCMAIGQRKPYLDRGWDSC
jgi:hypothetical protein